MTFVSEALKTIDINYVYRLCKLCSLQYENDVFLIEISPKYN